MDVTSTDGDSYGKLNISKYDNVYLSIDNVKNYINKIQVDEVVTIRSYRSRVVCH